MRARVLTLAVTVVLVLATPPPISTAQQRLPAQLGFMVLCRTLITDVTARLGPGTLVYQNPEDVSRGWYDAAARIYLLVTAPGVDSYKRRGLSGAPPVVVVELVSESHAGKVPRLQVKTLGRPRLSLTLLRGPNGIRLRDSKKHALRLLGRHGYSGGLTGNAETINFFNGVYTARPREGCAPEGFILQVGFTSDLLTQIWIGEQS